jgi:hypothetical protein
LVQEVAIMKAKLDKIFAENKERTDKYEKEAKELEEIQASLDKFLEHAKTPAPAYIASATSPILLQHKIDELEAEIRYHKVTIALLIKTVNRLLRGFRMLKC